MAAFPSAEVRPHLSAADLARLCKISRPAITRHLVEGRLPYTRLPNGRTRIEHAAARAFYLACQERRRRAAEIAAQRQPSDLTAFLKLLSDPQKTAALLKLLGAAETAS